MTKWEYMTDIVPMEDGLEMEFESTLDHWGQEGWELLVVQKIKDELLLIFKRPLSEKE